MFILKTLILKPNPTENPFSCPANPPQKGFGKRFLALNLANA
jgi:hypothetical protein